MLSITEKRLNLFATLILTVTALTTSFYMPFAPSKPDILAFHSLRENNETNKSQQLIALQLDRKIRNNFTQ